MLEIPAWVPVPVRRYILICEALFAGIDESKSMSEGFESHLAILRRVATDSRMRYVWRELVRYKAARQVIRKSGHSVVSVSDQLAPDVALVKFFECAWQRARFPYLVTTPADRAARAAPWSKAAELCRWEKEHDIVARLNPELSVALGVVARHFDEVARREGRLDSPLVVQRHNQKRGDDQARAYVRVLIDLNRKLFGQVLARTVATTATVALQRHITERQVRNWAAE